MPNLDNPDCKEDRTAFETRLDSLGVEQVRLMAASGAFPTGHNVVVLEWLKRQDNEKAKA